MITLITGTPGSGKTLYAVWMLAQEVKRGRRIVVDGIKDLAIEHELVDEPWIRDWWEQCRANDMIVVDEVQRIWPPVSVSVKATVDIEKLHEHRHKGVDFIMITQHPQRLNKTIRDLVGRHVHVRRLFGLKQAMVYEWDHCHNPNAGFRDAVKTRWGYPRKVFDMYTSAEVHTKQKAVIPKALFILPIALLVAIWLGWKGFKSVSGFGKTDTSASALSPLGALGESAGKPVGASGKEAVKNVASTEWRVAGQYAIDGRGYVLLADRAGRLRTELSDSFRGETMRLEGVVDGERVAVWSGAGSDGLKKNEAKK